MIERRAAGDLPRKHHIALRDASGALRYEECLTRGGFESLYTILYHQGRPHAQRPLPDLGHGWAVPESTSRLTLRERPLRKRHYRTQALGPSVASGASGASVASGASGASGRAPMDARVPLLWNRDVVLSVSRPGAADPVYFSNGDADDLHYIQRGAGLLRTVVGDLRFRQGDYVHVPRGLVHRFVPDAEPQEWLTIESTGPVGVPKQWRNEAGQLRMDAPYSHRDFRGPDFVGPVDEGIRAVVVKRGGAFHAFEWSTSPLDVVGWDGTIYPIAFAILDFQARVGLVHLPPTWHGTFALPGALVCSFVPRPLDFHPEAIPCPYPHTSVDCDEFIFYAAGKFTSRRGVGPGSISHHPAGIPHGPHPGAYEGSLGARSTDELAVMLDTFAPLCPTDAALAIEDASYQDSFL